MRVQPYSHHYREPASYAKPEVLNKQRITAICIIAASILAIVIGVCLGPAALPVILAGVIGVSVGTITYGAADLQQAAGDPNLSSASKAARVVTGLLYVTGGALIPVSPICSTLLWAGFFGKIITWCCERY